MVSVVISPALVWLSLTDLRRHVIPDPATLVVAIIGLLHAALKEGPSLWPDILGAVGILVILGGASEIFWRYRRREALGLGDVKLIAASVLLVGLDRLWVFMLLACTGGIAASLLSLGKSKSGIPFGPFLAYALFLTVLFT